jgi:hypothetical protein
MFHVFIHVFHGTFTFCPHISVTISGFPPEKNTPAISTNLGTYLRRNFGPHGFGMSGGNSWIICHNVDTRLAPLVMFVGVSTPLLASYYAVLIIAIKPSEIGVINTPWPHAN